MVNLERCSQSVECLPTDRPFDIYILSGGIVPKEDGSFRITGPKDLDPRGRHSFSYLRKAAAVVLSRQYPLAEFITSTRSIMEEGRVYPFSDAAIMRDELVEDRVDVQRIWTNGNPIDTFTEVLEAVFHAFEAKKTFLAILTNFSQIERAEVFLRSLFDAEKYFEQFQLLLDTYSVRFPKMPDLEKNKTAWEEKIQCLRDWQNKTGDRAGEWAAFADIFQVAFLSSESIIVTQGEEEKRAMKELIASPEYQEEIASNKNGITEWEEKVYGERYMRRAA